MHVPTPAGRPLPRWLSDPADLAGQAERSAARAAARAAAPPALQLPSNQTPTQSRVLQPTPQPLPGLQPERVSPAFDQPMPPRCQPAPRHRPAVLAYDAIKAIILDLPRSRLPEASRAVWQGLAEGSLTDDQAAELDQLIKVRLATPRAGEVPRRHRSVGSRPRSAASIHRRRMHVASGMMPPGIAAGFTCGEQAVLAIIAYEHVTKGACDLPVGAIAAKAGVGETTVRNALRQARKLGLVTVQERRQAYDRSLPNVVTIVDSDWQAWLSIRARKLRQDAKRGEASDKGGCKFVQPTDTHSSTEIQDCARPARFATEKGNRGEYGVRSVRPG